MFYLDLFAAFARHQVEYVLIGGLAVSLHGVERSTMDIDVSVAMTPANLAALVAMARALDLQPVLPVPLETLADPALLAQWQRERHLEAFALRSNELAGVTLDVLIKPAVDFSHLHGHAVTFTIRDTPVVVASINDLITLKQAVGRPIDLADIDHLRRLQD